MTGNHPCQEDGKILSSVNITTGNVKNIRKKQDHNNMLIVENLTLNFSTTKLLAPKNIADSKANFKFTEI